MGNWLARGQQPVEADQDVENEASEPFQFTRFRYDPENDEGGREFLLELPLSSHPVPPPHLWKIPTYMPHVHAKLTDDMVRKAEEKLGVTLPKLLIEMLRQQHGGIVRKSYSITFEGFFGLSDDEMKPNMVHAHQWKTWRDAKEKAKTAGRAEVGTDAFDTPPEDFELLVPIAGDECHLYYCLDYRTHGPQAEPHVTYIDVECQNDSELAISLTAFVQQFRSEVDECTTSVTRETDLPGQNSLVGSALISTNSTLPDVLQALVQRVKEDNRGVWSTLPDKPITITQQSHGSQYRGAAEQAEVMNNPPMGVWIRASSCLTYEREEPDAKGGLFYSGELVHSVPESRTATHVVQAPREVFNRIMQVLPTMEGVEVLFPPPPPP